MLLCLSHFLFLGNLDWDLGVWEDWESGRRTGVGCYPLSSKFVVVVTCERKVVHRTYRTKD